jgi:hypothetical protein
MECLQYTHGLADSGIAEGPMSHTARASMELWRRNVKVLTTKDTLRLRSGQAPLHKGMPNERHGHNLHVQ